MSVFANIIIICLHETEVEVIFSAVVFVWVKQLS